LPEILAEPIQMTKAQISQVETSTKKRKRTIDVPKTPTEKKIRSKRIERPGET
jgi:hypothetical protein